MDQTAARVLLVLLPPGERRLEFAEPMGTPAVLATRIAELLPGTTFDADRHGTFRRGGYEITFDFVAERTAIAQATAIEVTVGRGEGFTAPVTSSCRWTKHWPSRRWTSEVAPTPSSIST